MQMRCQRYGEARFYISAFAFDSLTTYGIESSFLTESAKMALEVEEPEKAKCLFLCFFMFFFYVFGNGVGARILASHRPNVSPLF